ncbi:2-dehydropantoate 2-reductase [Virgibacillus ainsalahensis]
MNIGVIGGGSIGLLLGSYLSAEHRITIYVRRKEHEETINKHGLVIPGNSNVSPVEARLISEMKKEDCIFICVKQEQLTSTLPEISKLNADTPLIFLQNGMGHTERMKKSSQPIMLGVVEHGAFRMNDHTVVHTGKGSIKLAGFNIQERMVKTFADKLTQPVFPVYSVDDWSALLAEKLIVNAVINPLTALFNVRNGDILQNIYINNLAKELCNEASHILGFEMEEQWKRVEKIAQNTKNNISSMLKDIQENRKTEIESMSGYLIKHADETTPITSFVYTCIKALEVKKGIS